MKFLNTQSMKRIPFLRWGERIPRSTSAAAMVSIVDKKAKVPLGSCRSTNRCYVPKRWVYKLRSQWKRAIGWHKSSSSTTSQFSYDIRSYALNFDDDGCLDQVLRSRVL
ncbi:unnamed protein product [Linum tenue]|uniref:Uncharacterized protein n=1 Tax=Linum tenue TaxID=586396 RepID=A0AAV0J750_9ROSI|nr:unnamed protein product [Linum tenue]